MYICWEEILLGILQGYLDEKCDKRLPGILNFSVKEGYSILNRMIEDNKILQLKDAKKAYGHIRHVCVDIVIAQELERQDIEAKIDLKQVSKNGYTYPVIEVNGAIITAHKIFKPHLMPRSSWNRTNRSFLNREISLFDEENLNLDENQVPYVMLTYGGLDYKLDFVQLSLPDEGVTKWLDRVSITNAPYLVKGYTSNQRKDFELTFTKKVEEILEKENIHGTSKIQS